MARRHTANAIVSRQNIQFAEWMDGHRAQHEGIIPSDHVNRIAKKVLRTCDPKKFLLSHATIVASVDTYAPKGATTGKRSNRGVEIDVRWADFRVKPECRDIVNNNGDAWERSLLLSTYRTFIGAQNYLEHIQLPELSKGFIVDAIARDLGRTCYIDILVATDRKHEKLIQDILAGEIDSMSMGCHLAGTKVYLSDGSPINIEDVRPDMEVLSQRGNACRVENLQIRENRWNVQTIKSVGLPPLTSTDNHNYYVVRRETVESVRRRPGGAKSKPQVVEKDYPFDYAEAGTVRVGDFLALPISQVEESTSVSLLEARLLGLWVGDGWKFENKHDSTVGVGFCLDEAHPEIVQDAIRSLDQVAWKHRESHMVMGGNPVSASSTSVSNRRGAAYLTNTSRAFRGLVDAHTAGRNSSTKLIGKSVMSWPRAHQMAFLSGLIDSDGCVSTSKRGTKNVFLSTRNENLAHQYMQLAARCGVLPTLSRAVRPGTKMLPNASGVDFQVKLRNADVVRVPSLKVQSSLGGIRSSQAGRNNRWITDRYVYSEVKSITKSKHVGFVYDLEVDEDHSYVANGVGVSNCISLFTTCTKCGNVAVDDSQLCPCVAYEGKGTKFVDDEGQEHVISELIGNVAIPHSNQFIEASWVGNPAFRGAVRRNILNPEASAVAAKLQGAAAVHQIKARAQVPEGISHAASVRTAEGEDPSDEEKEAIDDAGGGDDSAEDLDLGGPPDDEGGSDAPAADAPSANSMDDLINKARELIMEDLVKGLSDRMVPKPEDVGTVAPSGLSPVDALNDNLVRSSVDPDFARAFPNGTMAVWATGVRASVRSGRTAGLSPRDLLVHSWMEDRIASREAPPALYKLAIAVGPSSNFPSETSFLAACRIKAGRELTPSESLFLRSKGKIASLV